MAWQATLPKLAGYRMGAPNEAVHGNYVPPGQPKNAPNQGEPPAPAILNFDAVAPSSVTDSTPTAAQTRQDNAQRILHGSVSATRQTELDRTAVNKKISNLLQDQNPISEQPPMVTSADINTANTLPTAVNPKFIGKRYVEDILNDLNQQSSQPQPVKPNEKKPLPISFNDNYHDVKAEAGNGLTGPPHIGRTMLASVFAQIYGDFVTGAFQEIDLTIRGDPYWLGQTNLQCRIVLSGNQQIHDSSDIPDWSTGKPAIFVYFRYPLQIGDDFKPVLKDNEVFNGLYEVVKVKHTFAEGAFKQVVHAIRMPRINIDRAYDADPAAVGNNDQGSSPNGSQATSTPSTGKTPGLWEVRIPAIRVAHAITIRPI